MNKKIAIIGHFGGQENFTDGQTVKTINLYNELKQATNWNIYKVDTYEVKKSKIKFIVNMIFGLLYSKHVIVLLSRNGMRMIFPVLSFLSKHFRYKVYHDMIGGSMAELVDAYEPFKDYLRSFSVNWVETQMLSDELKERGINNTEIVPNFRRFEQVNHSDKNYCAEPFKFCTFSRVIKEKGIGEAVIAIETVNREEMRTLCTLDIYGPIDKLYEQEFREIMDKASDAICYMGEVRSSQATDVLKNYYATLFPTWWESEGCAGTISESLIAGVPVIATDWRCNSEMIQDGMTGIIYPGKYAEDLVAGIKWIIEKKDVYPTITSNCFSAGEYYVPDLHIKKIIDYVELEGL